MTPQLLVMLAPVYLALGLIAVGGWILAGYLQSWYYRVRTRRWIRTEVARMQERKR